MAAISGEPRRGGVDDQFGVTTLDDRAFVYRSVAALCGAGLTLKDALQRVVATLASPVENPEASRRVRHYAQNAVARIDGDTEGGTVSGILDASGFLMYDVERCMLAVDLGTAPRDVAVAFSGALGFVVSMQARPGQKSRR